jgi:hypothetical protein
VSGATLIRSGSAAEAATSRRNRNLHSFRSLQCSSSLVAPVYPVAPVACFYPVVPDVVPDARSVRLPVGRRSAGKICRMAGWMIGFECSRSSAAQRLLLHTRHPLPEAVLVEEGDRGHFSTAEHVVTDGEVSRLRTAQGSDDQADPPINYSWIPCETMMRSRLLSPILAVRQH